MYAHFTKFFERAQYEYVDVLRYEAVGEELVQVPWERQPAEAKEWVEKREEARKQRNDALKNIMLIGKNRKAGLGPDKRDPDCMALLKALKSDRESGIFAEPVHRLFEGLPMEYFDKVGITHCLGVCIHLMMSWN